MEEERMKQVKQYVCYEQESKVYAEKGVALLLVHVNHDQIWSLPASCVIASESRKQRINSMTKGQQQSRPEAATMKESTFLCDHS